MAEAYLEKRLKELGKKGISVSSAGISPYPGMSATEEAKKVMKEEGADLSGHIARKLTDLAIREADLIFVMEEIQKRYILGIDPSAEEKTYLLKDFRKIGDFATSNEPDIKDPIGKDIHFYKKTFAIIKESVERILDEIDKTKAR